MKEQCLALSGMLYLKSLDIGFVNPVIVLWNMISYEFSLAINEII